jgi:hypothetical protein
MQPMTLYFRVGGLPADVHIPELRQDLIDIMARAKASGELVEPYDKVHLHRCALQTRYGIQCNHVVGLDGTDAWDLSKAELIGRRQVHAMFRLFRERSPAFARAHLVSTAAHIGVRETRRVVGEYRLNEEDVISGRRFVDGVARSKCSASLHNPEGPHRSSCIRVESGGYHEIPYRSLLPLKVDNVVLGSRCLSATHGALAAVRMIPTMFSVGEAAGIAAAWAVRDGVSPHDLDGAALKAHILTLAAAG